MLRFTSLAVLVLAFVSSPSAAVELTTKLDLPYVQSGHALQKLDVYTTADAANRPVIVWIHGGGWRRGDKAPLHRKPQAFVDRGFVVASINYRFFPEVTMKEMMGDVAKAVRWMREHAKEFGGDPDRIVVMGHSAGAHLAALVCTDDRYLKAEGVPFSALKACVPVDVSVYDIPLRMTMIGSVGPATFTALFGETTEAQAELSPVMHAAAGKGIPPFLILHVADRPETKAQSHHFAAALKKAGGTATVVAGEGKTHGSISADLGLPDDEVTKALFAFFDEHVPSGK